MRNIFQAAGQRKHGQLLEKIMRGEDFRQRDENGLSPLMWAVIRGSVDTVRVLTEAGASPNEYDVVSLHLLKRIAGFYLRDELNLRDVFPDTNAPDIQFRSTPLHMAVLRGYDKMIAELVRHGGDATLRTECELPLLQGDAYVLLESFCWGAGDECRAALLRPESQGLSFSGYSMYMYKNGVSRYASISSYCSHIRCVFGRYTAVRDLDELASMEAVETMLLKLAFEPELRKLNHLRKGAVFAALAWFHRYAAMVFEHQEVSFCLFSEKNNVG